MLNNWLPFLIYGFFAFAIPASMLLFSFVFAQRPARRTRARVIPFESGVSTGPPPTHVSAAHGTIDKILSRSVTVDGV